jgi:hypothetical protein
MYYQLRVQGYLEPHWSAWFDGLAITYDADGDTILAGPVRDQTALYGLIDKARDLGLTLIAVMRYEPERQASGTPVLGSTGGQL